MAKIINLFIFLSTMTLYVCCNGLSLNPHNVCNIDINFISELRRSYGINHIRTRLDYYEVFYENNKKLYISLNKNNFYFENYMSTMDSLEIQSIVNVLDICNEFEVKNLSIDKNYYFSMNEGGTYIYQVDINEPIALEPSEKGKIVNIKDKWFYYKP